MMHPDDWIARVRGIMVEDAGKRQREAEAKKHGRKS